jgi:hypothetical protein
VVEVLDEELGLEGDDPDAFGVAADGDEAADETPGEEPTGT